MQFETAPGAAVAAVLRRGAGAIEVRAGLGAPPVRTIPVLDGRCAFLVDVAGDLREHSYTALLAARERPGAFPDVRGKIVVIGYEVPEEVWRTDKGAPRYEMEIQASAIAQMLHGAYLRRPGVAAQFVVILALGGVAWFLRAGGRAWTTHTIRVVLPPPIGRPVQIPTALLATAVVYALAAFVAGKSLRGVPRFTYDLLALVLTYVAVGWATRGVARPRFPRRETAPAERSAVAG
jgi:CHASE2 domain-containing sensor protein